jgi:hypothetical protein
MNQTKFDRQQPEVCMTVTNVTVPQADVWSFVVKCSCAVGRAQAVLVLLRCWDSLSCSGPGAWLRITHPMAVTAPLKTEASG